LVDSYLFLDSYAASHTGKFTRLIYGFLGNKRIPLPSCAYTAIRKTFPIDKEEHFVGYSDDSD
jgi:hypothetical protein